MRHSGPSWFDHPHFHGVADAMQSGYAVSTLEADLIAECDLLRKERDAARQALGRSSEERSLSLANLSHELRTPLNAILGYADLLLLDTDHTGAPLRYTESIKEAGTHLLSIVESVLDMSRLRAGSLDLAEAESAPKEIIASVIRVLAPLAARAGVILIDKSAGHLPLIYADAQVLRQILINLVSNAIKASPDGAAVSVSAQLKSSGAMQFQVRDSGPGMNPQTIERVMQPFAQGEKATGFGAAGAGLGLALVRSLAELHDGHFQLVSHVGRGTRAIVTLPRARVRMPARPGQQVEFAFTRAPAPLGA